jgi:DNA segregation ATPase FtsK/SpoIIIE-like protein
MDCIVLVIDELAELNHKPSQECLETLLRLCRATGIHIILATQRPDSTIFGNKKFGSCKANLIGRLCFQVADGVNSKIILDSTEAATLPNIPGRAIWKLGNKTTELQVPYLDPEIAEVRLLEQSSEVYEQGQFDGRDISRMGDNGHRATTNPIISLLQSGTKAITTLTRTKKS